MSNQPEDTLNTDDANDHEPQPVDPDDADDVGIVGGSGGPASIIYGEDDEVDEHGEDMLKAPDES